MCKQLFLLVALALSSCAQYDDPGQELSLSDDAAYQLIGLAVEKDMTAALEAYGLSAEDAAAIAAAARAEGDLTLEDASIRLAEFSMGASVETSSASESESESEEEKVKSYLKGVAKGAVTGVMSKRTSLTSLAEGPVGVLGVVGETLVAVMGQEPISTASVMTDEVIGRVVAQIASRLLREGVAQGLISGSVAGELRSAFSAILPKLIEALDQTTLSGLGVDAALGETLAGVFSECDADSLIDDGQLLLAGRRMMGDLAESMGTNGGLALDASGAQVARELAESLFARGDLSTWGAMESTLCTLLQDFRTSLASGSDAFSGIAALLNNAALASGATVSSSCSD